MSEETLAALIRRACLWEATARKPGNVHPGAAFDDLTFEDLVVSAHAAAPELARAARAGVGPAARAAIAETQTRVGRISNPSRPTTNEIDLLAHQLKFGATTRIGTNTNLGIVLLIAPLAVVPKGISLANGIEAVLRELTVADVEAVYEAIRLARPGGLGRVEREDVSRGPTGTLVEVMALAADRDRVARQYVTGFADVLHGAERLRSLAPDAAWQADSDSLPEGLESPIIRLHLEFLAAHPDSLIARKSAEGEVAAEASRRAAAVLQTGLDTAAGIAKLREYDAWLRADGHRRNPGTTADLVAAALFAVLRDGFVSPRPTGN